MIQVERGRSLLWELMDRSLDRLKGCYDLDLLPYDLPYDNRLPLLS